MGDSCCAAGSMGAMSYAVLGVDLEGDPDLLEVRLAGNAPRRLPGALHRGEQKPHQCADDGDHHEQFHEGETM